MGEKTGWILNNYSYHPGTALLKAQEEVEKWHIPMESTEHYYRIIIEDITPEPEKPGWWYWDKQQKWVISFERQARIDVRNGEIESVVVHGTSDDRSEKAQSLLDAILKAGKP